MVKVRRVFSGEKALEEIQTACKYIVEFNVTREGNVICLMAPSKRKVSGYFETSKGRLDFESKDGRIAFKVSLKKPITMDDSANIAFFVNEIGHLVEPPEEKDEAVDIKRAELWFKVERKRVVVTDDDALLVTVRAGSLKKLREYHGEIKMHALTIRFEQYFDATRFTIKGKLTTHKLRKITGLIETFETI